MTEIPTHAITIIAMAMNEATIFDSIMLMHFQFRGSAFQDARALSLS